MERIFRKRLLDWYHRVHRPLPWRATRDPYAIWISEVMLQQTRVATVLPYFERWMQRFPNVQSLAGAPQQDVLQVWSGLGYYSRARNLQKAAKQMDNRFPSDYDSIRALPGIGDYTAAAIASIAFGLPHAAVDGNVLRVMSRLTNDSGDVSSTATRRRLAQGAHHLLDTTHAGIFNQAMMELGATICHAKNPHCVICPVAGLCEARRIGSQHQLPVKLRRTNKVSIDRTLLIVSRKGHFLFRQSADFWELPEPQHVPGALLAKCCGNFRHTITNHNYSFAVCEAFVKRTPRGLRWLRPDPLQYLLSTTARKALTVAGVSGF
jgi:A/G-specific adenine glycosylase